MGIKKTIIQVSEWLAGVAIAWLGSFLTSGGFPQGGWL
jgi:hypothetical protein